MHHRCVRKPIPLPHPFHAAPFVATTAERYGIGRSRLRRHDLEQPFRGVRIARLRDDPTRKKWQIARDSAIHRARAYAAKLPPECFFSHVTAAQFHGLPLPRRLAERAQIDVATMVDARRRRGLAVRGHLLLSGDVSVVQIDGMSVASAVDTWCQLASVLSIDQLVIMGDALVRREDPPATMDHLYAAVERRSGRRGIRRLRDALALVRPRTDSVKETELRLAILRAGLPEPEINVPICDADGFIGLGDLVYRALKILIEYDGGQHREDEKQFLHDVDRLDRAMAEGWRVIRVTKKHAAARFEPAIERIRDALIKRGWRR